MLVGVGDDNQTWYYRLPYTHIEHLMSDLMNCGLIQLDFCVTLAHTMGALSLIGGNLTAAPEATLFQANKQVRSARVDLHSI